MRTWAPESVTVWSVVGGVVTPPKLMLVLKGPMQVVLVGLAPPSDPPVGYWGASLRQRGFR